MLLYRAFHAQRSCLRPWRAALGLGPGQPKLIEYLGSEAAQTKQAELGVTMSAWDGTSEAWVNCAPEFNLQAYLDMRDDMVIRPYSRNTVTWENRASELLKEAWAGNMTMEDTCKQIAEEMNATLAEEQ